MVVYLAYGSTANFRFRGSIAKLNISKERQDYGDRSGPRILEIDTVIQKLSRFPQVQSEREWTLVDMVNNYYARIARECCYFSSRMNGLPTCGLLRNTFQPARLRGH